MGVDTLVGLFDYSVEQHKDRIAVRRQIPGMAKSDRGWTFDELRERSYGVANRLVGMGVKKGDRVMIVTDNEPRFTAADLGVLYAGAISVPVDQNLRVPDMYREYIKHVEPKVIVSSRDYSDKLDSYSGNVPVMTLDTILSPDPFGPNIEINPSDPSTIIFSSGTTSVDGRGFKGVVLTNDNICSNILATRRLARLAEEEDGADQGIYLGGLAKQWHAFDYGMQKSFLLSGGRVHFTNRSDAKRGYAAHVNPHYAVIIPTIANEMLDDVRSEVRKKGTRVALAAFDRLLANSSRRRYAEINEGIAPEEDGWSMWFHNFADKRFYGKVRDGIKNKFGENKMYFVGGSAPLSVDTQVALDVLGSRIYMGYGLTQTSPVVSVFTDDEFRFGSSGKVIKGVEVIIADSGQLDNDSVVEVGNGESGTILVNGPNVFREYWRDPEQTEAAFVNHDGRRWFNTEDLGRFEGGFLFVGGRMNNTHSLPNGEIISHEQIEQYYRRNGGLDMMIVHGETGRTGALIFSNNGASARTVRKDAEKVLSDCQSRFGFGLGGRLEVITNFDSSKFETGLLKRQREKIKRAYPRQVERATR